MSLRFRNDRSEFQPCPSDSEQVSRRAFLKAASAGVVVSAASYGGLGLRAVSGADSDTLASSPSSESLAAQLYSSLTEQQKTLTAFDFDDPLRQKVDANWHVTEARIGKDFTGEQQALIREIFLSLHSPRYAKAVLGQVEHDNGRNGFRDCSIALFGHPGTGKFEFVLTGRHVTRRCDGDSVEGAAFGGPIFYGHAAESFNEKPNHPGNIYWYQALRANKLFQALDGKQRTLALRTDARKERGTETVRLTGKKSNLRGLPIAELSPDQKNLARRVMADVLAPFREADARESLQLIDANGFDNLRMAFYKNMDIGDDGVWDVWQIEGPNMVWYFRGKPHVHTWVHIREA